jgi:hypothetical protein
MNMEQTNNIEDIKRKYLQRIATDEEKRILFEYLEDKQEEYKDFIKQDIDWTISNFPDDNASQKKIESFMNIVPRKNKLSLIYKIAAVLAIPLLVLSIYQYFYFSRQINMLENNNIAESNIIPVQKGSTFEYKVNPGVKGLINLPDGSKVWLNSNSELKCPQKFDKNQRSLELKGEGYFIVESNKKWPMFIKTVSGYTVKVTGTEFNLSSYENDKAMKLTMVSGKVKLINELNNKSIDVNKLEEVTITSNNQIYVKDKSKAIQILNTGWKDGLLLFGNTPMEEVIKKMERWYGVKIIVNDPIIYNNRFTGEFESESLIQVLEFMTVTSGVKYSVKDKVFFLSPV